MHPMSAAALVLGLLGAGADLAGARDYQIVPGIDDTLVRFDSKATLESFSGETHRVSGRIGLVTSSIGDSIHVVVEVEMASLDTGIDKRNRDMRENHLETERYPAARFAGASVRAGAGSQLTPGVPLDLEIEGTFTLHGVTRRMRVPVTLTAMGDGRALHAVSRFSVRLEDYAIERPRFLFMKLAEEQIVTVDVVAGLAGDAP